MARTAAVDARRAQLLRVGKQVFSARAYDTVSTEEIADVAGISVGLLYHYFANKKGFYVATIRAAADELLAATRFPPGVDLVAATPVALGGFLDFIEANSVLYQGLMRGGVGADGEVHTIVDEVRATLLTRILDAAGVVADPALRVSLYGWLGFVEFASLRWLTHREVSRHDLLTLLLRAVPADLLTDNPA
jgi:AcrR family transcriptional regulator